MAKDSDKQAGFVGKVLWRLVTNRPVSAVVGGEPIRCVEWLESEHELRDLTAWLRSRGIEIISVEKYQQVPMSK